MDGQDEFVSHGPFADTSYLAYNLLLAEYSALRAEILLGKEQIERTYGFLLAFLGAVAASQFLKGSYLKELNQHPIYYLLFALFAFWFPANYLCMALDMTSLGTYLREVTAPKLNEIIRCSLPAGSGDSFDALYQHAVGFTIEVGRNIATPLRRNLVNPMAWEEFLVATGKVKGLKAASRGIVFLIRNLMLYSPAMLLVVIFFTRVTNMTWTDYLMLVLLGVLTMSCGYFALSGSSLVMFRLRIGNFGRKHDR